MKILLAHGSTDLRHGEQVQALACKVSALLDENVGVSFLDDGALPKGATVLPLFLGEGKHVCEDIPTIITAAACVALPSLNVCADRIAALALDEATKETRRINALFALYRFGGFEKLAEALYSQVKTCSKHAMASLHSEPSLTAVLEHWQQEGVKPIALQPMLLFEGKSMDRLRAMSEPFDVTMKPVLSEYDDFPALVAQCFKASE